MKSKLSLTLAFALLVNLIIGYTAYSEERENVGGDDEVLASIETIMHVLQLIRRNYVDIDKVTTKELLEGALNGMTEKLDPFSVYLPPKDLKSLVEDTEGAFGGIGVSVSITDGKVHIVAITPDTPGEKVGLQAGDIITSVDDKPLSETDLQNAVLRLRGKPGTEVKVAVWRQSEGKTLEFNITRAMIPVQNVTNAQVIEGTSIGFVRITQFMEPTAQNLQKVLRDFETKKITSLIIDLRGNPGGLLESAVDVCSFFLPKDKLVVTVKRHSETHENRDSENFKEYRSKAGYKFPSSIKLVLLVDGASASASEITAGCLRDHRRAVLLGTKTYGKGSVQNIVELGNGSAVKLTMARYYSPDPVRPTIDKNGIEPDITVDISMKNLRAVMRGFEEGKLNIDKDTQLARAIQLLKSLDVLAKND